MNYDIFVGGARKLTELKIKRLSNNSYILTEDILSVKFFNIFNENEMKKTAAIK